LFRTRVEKVLHQVLLGGEDVEAQVENLVRFVNRLDEHTHKAFSRMLKDKKYFRDALRDHVNLLTDTGKGAAAGASDRLAKSRKRLLAFLPTGTKLEKIEANEVSVRSIKTIVTTGSTDKQITQAKVGRELTPSLGLFVSRGSCSDICLSVTGHVFETTHLKARQGR